MNQRKLLYINPENFLPIETSNEDVLVGKNTIPSGGEIGQVLKKNNDNDYEYSWQDSIRILEIPLGGLTQTIDLNSQLNGYYSYKTVDSTGTEVSIVIKENSLIFDIVSNVDMTNLKLQVRGF